MKAVMAQDAFLRYSDHNKPFHIYCDASDLQLGAVIMQDDAPVAFYSRKLNSAQKITQWVKRKSFLLLKPSKNIALCSMDVQTSVYTDHKNNNFTNLQTQCILHWRLFLEDYVVKFRYIKGESNSLAYTLSRLPFDERQNPPNQHDHLHNLHDATGHIQTLELYSAIADDADLLDLFVHLPLSANVPFVLDYQSIAQAQIGDAQLQQ
jgi:RNase H-like domain found in reverse transcriptase